MLLTLIQTKTAPLGAVLYYTEVISRRWQNQAS